MGFNPGGDPYFTGSTIIHWAHETDDDYCDYEADWGWREGEAPHQKRVKEYARLLGEPDIKRVFAANAIFLRSRDQGSFPNANEMWKRSWPVHQFFLSIVRPKFIVCLGNGDGMSSFSLLASVANGIPRHSYFGQKKSFRDGKWFDGVFDVDGGQLVCKVIGVPHPSRFGISQNLEKELRSLGDNPDCG